MMYEIAIVISFGRDKKSGWPSVRFGLRLVTPDQEPAEPKRPVRVFPTEPPLPSLSGPPSAPSGPMTPGILGPFLPVNGTTARTEAPAPEPPPITGAVEGLVRLGYTRKEATGAALAATLKGARTDEEILRESLMLLAAEGAAP